MSDRATLAGLALLLLGGGALVVLSRRQGAPVAADADAGDLEEIRVTAQRLPTAEQPLEEIVVTASRLPETWVTKTTDAIASAAGQVWDMVKNAALPRGIRNNNPGNLERTGTKWKGMAAQQSDPRFIVFEAPSWGVRALGRVLKTYESRGLDTVRAIVNRWAPPIENNTSAYVTAVARALGVSPDQRISVDARLAELAAAIIKHENGQQPYSPADIAAWVRLA